VGAVGGEYFRRENGVVDGARYEQSTDERGHRHDCVGASVGPLGGEELTRYPFDQRTNLSSECVAHGSVRSADFRCERRHGAAPGGVVAVLRRKVFGDECHEGLGRLTGLFDEIERFRQRTLDAGGGEGVLGLEVSVETAVGESGRLHHPRDADAVESVLAEHLRRRIQDLLVPFGGVLHGIAHGIHDTHHVSFKPSMMAIMNGWIERDAVTATGQVVLVTGASSGIGKTTAEHLAARGYRVFAGARRPDAVSPLPGAELIALDVTDDASVSEAVASILEKAGRIDALINNAGSSILGAVEETSIDQARSLLETNVLGVLRMSQAVLPTMRRQHAGRIVNVSSVVGFLPSPYMSVYAASKHAIEGLSESMDHEVRSFGVRVVLVEPGFTRTNIDAASPRAERPLDAYAVQRERVINSINHQISSAPDPTAVAATIERAINASRFTRLPVGGQAALLSRLRRWMPPPMVDRSLRKTFSLDG
jgi:NAD(P)-dependent dehydrogenase (short-subunit alcohol dehydrogenase family)